MTNTQRLKSALLAIPVAGLTALAGFCISPALSASSAGATPTTTFVAESPANLAPDQFLLSGACIDSTTIYNDAMTAMWNWADPYYYNDASDPAGVWLNFENGNGAVWHPAANLVNEIPGLIAEGYACVPSELLAPAAPTTTVAPPTTTAPTTTPPTTVAPTTTVPPTTVATSYTVTFLANGGVGAQAVYTETDNAPTALTANPFNRSGYTFAGWNTAADGSGTAYADGATYPFTSDVTLYAQWAAVVVAPGAFTLTISAPCIINKQLVFNLTWTTPSGTAPFTYTVFYNELVAGIKNPQLGSIVVSGNTTQIQITGAHLLLSGSYYVTAANSAGTSTSNTVHFL